MAQQRSAFRERGRPTSWGTVCSRRGLLARSEDRHQLPTTHTISTAGTQPRTPPPTTPALPAPLHAATGRRTLRSQNSQKYWLLPSRCSHSSAALRLSCSDLKPLTCAKPSGTQGCVAAL
eukprot:353621-Chlamydomonas_euryale.AAC.1